MGRPLTSEEIEEFNRNGGLTDAEMRTINENLPSLGLLPKAPSAVDPQQPFPVDVLPDVVRQYVTEAADAIGCDRPFIFLPLLGCLARAIGSKRVIQLKRTWCEPAVIWGAIVGKSGQHKTPALDLGTAPLRRKQAAAVSAYTEALAQNELDRAIYERDMAAWKRAKGSEPPPWEPQTPTCERFTVSDITVEALADRLADQHDGVIVIRDELSGWVNGIGEYKGGKGGSDLGHWLACWSAAPLIVDRKGGNGGRKMINIPRAAVSIVGGIQPTVLRSAIAREHMADGLCARLLLALTQIEKVRWTENTVSVSAEAAVNQLVDDLCNLAPASDPEGRPIPYPLSMTPEAKAVWVDYFNRHREEAGGLDDDLAAAWSKLEAYTARFALIVQLCHSTGSEAIDQCSMESAIALSDWFGTEARRVYGLLSESPDDRESRELLELIVRLGGAVTVRELMRASRRYATADDAESALSRLAKAEIGGWDVDVHDGGRGQPSRRFCLSANSTPSQFDADHRNNTWTAFS